MNTPANNDNAAPKKQRRDIAREHARLQREIAAKKKRRNRTILQGGLIVGVLAILGIIVLVVVNIPHPSPAPTGSASKSGPLNMLSDGILLSGGGMAPVATAALQPGASPVPTEPSAHPNTVNIVTYVDYQCPVCQAFEAANSTQIKQWVEAGHATVEIHPISILDRESQGTNYSTRSANAMACVANYEPDVYYAVSTALFAKQPGENTTGLTDKQLTSIVQGAGATNASIPGCITGQEFSNWVTAATNRALTGPLPNANVKAVSGTPTVIVNGKSYTGAINDAAAFAQFVSSATTG